MIRLCARCVSSSMSVVRGGREWVSMEKICKVKSPRPGGRGLHAPSGLRWLRKVTGKRRRQNASRCARHAIPLLAIDMCLYPAHQAFTQRRSCITGTGGGAIVGDGNTTYRRAPYVVSVCRGRRRLRGRPSVVLLYARRDGSAASVRRVVVAGIGGKRVRSWGFSRVAFEFRENPGSVRARPVTATSRDQRAPLIYTILTNRASFYATRTNCFLFLRFFIIRCQSSKDQFFNYLHVFFRTLPSCRSGWWCGA